MKENLCDLCLRELMPDEDDRCRYCAEDALEHEADGEAFRGSEAAAYAREQHEAERGLK